MNTRTNILKFEPAAVEMPLELDEETLKSIDEVARADGKTRNDILQEALDQFLADFKIGDQLIDRLRSLRKSYPANKCRWDPIKIWEKRICEILERLGTEPSGTPTPGRAA